MTCLCPLTPLHGLSAKTGSQDDCQGQLGSQAFHIQLKCGVRCEGEREISGGEILVYLLNLVMLI